MWVEARRSRTVSESAALKQGLEPDRGAYRICCVATVVSVKRTRIDVTCVCDLSDSRVRVSDECARGARVSVCEHDRLSTRQCEAWKCRVRSLQYRYELLRYLTAEPRPNLITYLCPDCHRTLRSLTSAALPARSPLHSASTLSVSALLLEPSPTLSLTHLTCRGLAVGCGRASTPTLPAVHPAKLPFVCLIQGLSRNLACGDRLMPSPHAAR